MIRFQRVVALAAFGFQAAGGPGITRARAQQLARRELARSIYRPSLPARWWQDIKTFLASLFGAGAAGSPSWWGLILLGVLLLAVVAAVLFWLGPQGMSAPFRDRGVLGARARTADDYRGAAERMADQGNYRDAVSERMRAIAAELEEREILPPRPSRTAIELATEAGAAIPAERGALETAALLFDRVRYGGRAARETDYNQIADLDARIRSTSSRSAAADSASSAEPESAGRESAGLGR